MYFSLGPKAIAYAFVFSVVIPLITTLGINNKIAMLEKTGTGSIHLLSTLYLSLIFLPRFPNSTGAYELDLSLVSNFSATWREMHVKSDVFCAGSVILPDKVGRIINVGGWSLESTKGVRLYIPDGGPGKNSTNDWEENYPALALQVNHFPPSTLQLIVLTSRTMLARSVVSYGRHVGKWNDRYHWW